MILCLFYTNKQVLHSYNLSDSATTDFGFKQTKTEPQSPRLDFGVTEPQSPRLHLNNIFYLCLCLHVFHKF